MEKLFKELKIGDPIYMVSTTTQPKKAYIANITRTTNSSFYVVFGLKDKYGNKRYHRTIHRKFLNSTTSISTATNKEDAYKLMLKKILQYNQEYRRNEALC